MRERHNVYVIELDKDVLYEAKFKKANPDYMTGKPCVYVGMTGHDPDTRFDQHKAGIKSMAMPAIGTGVFKFPAELAAQIIINGLVNRSEEYSEIFLVRICVGTQELKAVFTSTLEASAIPQNL